MQNYKMTQYLMKEFFKKQILVRAEDRGIPPNVASNTATVLVRVLRNLNTPEFRSTPYTKTVSENEPVGSNIFKALAIDGDSSVSLL